MHRGRAVGRVGGDPGPLAAHLLHRREEALQLHVDGGRVLGDAGEVGHDARQLDLGDAADGLQEGADLRREEALAVHAAVDLQVDLGVQAGAPQVGQHLGHVVAHHGEVDVTAGPSPRTGRGCRAGP